MLSYEQHAVEALVGHGAPLDEIEAYIDTVALGSEERSALWLLAWAQTTNPATHRRAMTETGTRLWSSGNDRGRWPKSPDDT